MNLADAEDPAQNLVGIAQSASQGAITARQLAVRPIMRSGEVLETIPGVVISQHSGEGKANEYLPPRLQPRSRHRLRDDGGGHSREHADARARPRVLRLQLPDSRARERRAVRQGTVLRRPGRLRDRGSANINYTNSLDAPLVRVGAGQDGFFRTLVAASPRVGRGTLLAAFEGGHNDGPWVNPDDYGKLNGLVRYTQGDMVKGSR